METSGNNYIQAVEDKDSMTNKNAFTPENNLHSKTDRIDDEIAKSTSSGTNEIKLTHLPLSRIKQIMKLDSEITVVPLECVFLVTKATELFVQSLAREACTFTQQNDKKTLQKRDIDSAINQVESLIFLEETLN